MMSCDRRPLHRAAASQSQSDQTRHNTSIALPMTPFVLTDTTQREIFANSFLFLHNALYSRVGNYRTICYSVNSLGACAADRRVPETGVCRGQACAGDRRVPGQPQCRNAIGLTALDCLHIDWIIGYIYFNSRCTHHNRELIALR